MCQGLKEFCALPGEYFLNKKKRLGILEEVNIQRLMNNGLVVQIVVQISTCVKFTLENYENLMHVKI